MDVHALIWNKECLFEEDETGTEHKNKAWVCKEARNLPTKAGGLSLLNWGAHVKAIQVKPTGFNTGMALEGSGNK